MTEKLPLTIVVNTAGHTAAVKSGSAPIEGVEAKIVEVTPIVQAFRRMVRNVEFDVCELAPTTYMMARALGAPYIALPIFVMRRFHHGGFVVQPGSGIAKPKDLEGKRVGVRAYSVTTGVWTRGIFMNEYGMDSSKVTWVVDDEEHVTAVKLPPNVEHANEGQSLAGMMASGELQAGFTGRAGIGRAGPPVGDWEKRGDMHAADIYPELIADSAKVEADWYRRTGIYPIHGTIVVKEDVLKNNPWVGRALLDAFTKSKQPYLEKLKRGEADNADDKRYRDLMPLVGDPLPYGMAANRASIEALMSYALQQKLIPQRMPVEQAFFDPEKN